MKIKLTGVGEVILPNRQFGDSEEYDSPKIVTRNTTNDSIRFTDPNWVQKHSYTLIVGIPKCTTLPAAGGQGYSTFEQVVTFLTNNNGKLTTLSFMEGTTVVSSLQGYISVLDCAETLNTWNMSLKIVRIL